MFRLALPVFLAAGIASAAEPLRASAAEPLPLSGLAHAAFLTSDLDKAGQFYTGVLGYERVFDLKDDKGAVSLAFFKVNDEQFIEVFPGLKPEQDVRMSHIAMSSPDIAKLRAMLVERGIECPEIRTGRNGDRNFTIQDPEGTRIEFVQYMPGSMTWKSRGKSAGERRISTRLRHAGVMVANLDKAMAFYRDTLGFVETWRGGPDARELRWVNLRMPGDSGDYLELMLYDTRPSRASLGSMLHICLEVPDIQEAWKTVRERGVPDEERFRPRVGRNRKRQLNLFDPDGSRAELMEPRTVE